MSVCEANPENAYQRHQPFIPSLSAQQQKTYFVQKFLLADVKMLFNHPFKCLINLYV